MGANKRKRLGAGLLAAVLMLSMSGCASDQSSQSTSEYVSGVNMSGSGYRTVEVYSGDFTVPFSGMAMTQCIKTQNLYWESSEDRYGDILVQQGQKVKKGDVLATFEVTSVSEADILSQQLAIQQIDASLAKTSQQYEEAIAKKQESLAKLESYDYQIASLEIEKLQSDYAQQAAEAARQKTLMQESLQELLDQKENNKLVAPFDGSISIITSDYQKGDKVSTSTPIIVIEDLSSLSVVFQNQSMFGKVPYLSKVKLINHRSKVEYAGTVVSCSSVTGSKMDDIVVKPDEPLPAEETTGFYDVEGLLMEKTGVVLVSTEALREEGNSNYVFLLDENNNIQKTYVSVGASAEGVAWISDGLEPGQKVLVD